MTTFIRKINTPRDLPFIDAFGRYSTRQERIIMKRFHLGEWGPDRINFLINPRDVRRIKKTLELNKFLMDM